MTLFYQDPGRRSILCNLVCGLQGFDEESIPKLANAKIEKPKYMRDTEGYVPSVGHYNLINILVCCDCGLQNSRRYITGAINT